MKKWAYGLYIAAGVAVIIVSVLFRSVFGFPLAIALLIAGGIVHAIAVNKEGKKRQAEILAQRAAAAHYKQEERLAVIRNSCWTFAQMLQHIPEEKIVPNLTAIPVPGNPVAISRLVYSQFPQNAEAAGYFVALAVDTTGDNAAYDNIIEVSAIRFHDFTPVSIFNTTINSEDSGAYEAPAFAQISGQLEQFIGEYPIVGHNLPFSMKFLLTEGLSVRGQKLYDTKSLAEKAIKGEIYDNSLEGIAERVGLYYDPQGAAADALAAGLLFKQLVKRGVS